MKHRIPFSLFALFFLFYSAPLTAQSGGVTVLGNWTNPALPSHTFGYYNEIWGISVNGHEYGVIGSVRGTHFIDLDTDPLQEVFFVAGRDSVGDNIHRDFHNYGNYLYAVCDEGQSSLQIMDFSGLPNSVELVYDSDEFIVNSHNIFIDEDNARLYTNKKFYWFLSLEDPENPVKVDLSTSDTKPPRRHDLYVKDNIAYLNCEDDGLWIYDVSDPGDYKLLGNMTTYPNQGYNHSGWLNEAGTHYFLCEETIGADIKVIDVSDPADMEIKKRFNLGTPHPNLPHNAMIRGDYLYVAYYYDGFQMFDISNPEEPFRAAFYDTYKVDSEGFRGAWGVYSALPSGRIIVSDMAYGLFLFDITPGNYPIDAILTASKNKAAYCENLDQVVLDISVGPGFDDAGVTLDIPDLPTEAMVTYSENPAMPGNTVTVTVSELSALTTLRVTAIDDIDQTFYLDFQITAFADVPIPPPLLEPEKGSMNVGTSPSFSWEGNPFKTYLLEIAVDSTDFSGTLVYSEVIENARDLDLPIELFSGTYFWRVSTENDCGLTYSEVFEFSTNTVAVSEIETEEILVFPNPAKDFINISLPENTNDATLSLLDIQGKILSKTILPAGKKEHSLDLENHHGVFILRLESAGKMITKKVVFTP